MRCHTEEDLGTMRWLTANWFTHRAWSQVPCAIQWLRSACRRRA